MDTSQPSQSKKRIPRIRIENNGGKETQIAAKLVKEAVCKAIGFDEQKVEFEVTCDFCHNVIPDTDAAKCNFLCRQGKCSTSFDLCLKCQKLEPQYMSECPAGFKLGCNADEYKYSPEYSRKQENEEGIDDEGNDGSEDGSEDLFFALQEKPKPPQYNFGDTTFNIIGQRKGNEEDITQDITFLSKFLESTGLSYQGALFYRDGNELSHHCLADLWLHFRSSDQESITKYGPPSESGSLTIYNLGSSKLYHFYRELRAVFSRFIQLDNDDYSNKPLGLVFIYPNGDEFYIRHLYGEELEIRKPKVFVTQFFPFSEIPEWESRWQDPNKTHLFASLPHHKDVGKADVSKSICLSMGYLIPITN
jgi:hypothetical protein